LVVSPLCRLGTEEQKDRNLEALSFGEILGAFALSEPGAGSDAASLATTARREGDDYVLDGTKSWVCNAALAGLFLVFARAEGGITGFLIEAGTPGLTVGYREKTLGLRGTSCNTIYLDGVRVPAANRLGEEGQGLKIALEALNLSRLGMGALALGGAERALEEAVKFSMEHIQFKVPIAQKQIIQDYIADARTQIEALRQMVTYVAWLADSEGSFATPEFATNASMAYTVLARSSCWVI
ncbi:MAG: acyl-CoA dehydrogenase family protein, partial [Anaerolineae bacterium]